MMTEQQRKILIENWVLTILHKDRHNKNYDFIERLWNASGLTNKDLVNALLSKREHHVPDFRDCVFEDIVWLLKDAVSENLAVRSLFSDLYAKRYPAADKRIKNLESKITNGDSVKINVPEMTQFIRKGNTDEAEYFMFRVYASDTIICNDCVDTRFWELEYKNSLKNMRDASDYGDEEIIFTDGSGEEVFTSKMFERFVKRQKQALADYLKTDEGKLAKFYDEMLTIQEDFEDNTYGFIGSAFGLVPAAMMELIWLNGGSGNWLTNIQSLERRNKFAFRYRPDFDTLFVQYCRASVRTDYLAFRMKGVPFTPITLSKNCSFVEMEALAISIAYLYVADCMYQMFVQMQKRYYEDFSWEKYRNKDMKARYERVIQDLNSTISVKDHQLQNIRRLYTSLKESLEKKNDLAMIKEQQDKEYLLHQSEEKDAEIERLKAIIASQNQLIDQLQIYETAGESLEANSKYEDQADSAIYRYRYLFVGDIATLGFEELRRKFPSSIFMETNTVDISQIKVDAVVYLIQAMGHSMYYKCKNTSALQDAIVVYYNGRGNLTALLEAIDREVCMKDVVSK